MVSSFFGLYCGVRSSHYTNDKLDARLMTMLCMASANTCFQPVIYTLSTAATQATLMGRKILLDFRKVCLIYVCV